jgi:uncharacterized membrane protein YwaF
MNSIEVAIEYDDPRYWIMMGGALLFGFILHKIFYRAPADKKDKYLIVLGVTMISLQCYMPLVQALDPEYTFSFHINLPLHFCSINFWLMAFNCFLRSRMLFILTAYMGISGGFHSFMTPLLTAGDSIPQITHFIIVHSGLFFIPFIMMRHYGMKFIRFDWIRAYGFDLVLSTIMIGVNYYLNTYVENPYTDIANYMYVTEAPDVNNPLLPSSLAWPFYMFPIHLLFIAHMLLINQIVRWIKGVKLESWKEVFC